MDFPESCITYPPKPPSTASFDGSEYARSRQLLTQPKITVLPACGMLHVKYSSHTTIRLDALLRRRELPFGMCLMFHGPLLRIYVLMRPPAAN